MIGRYGMYYYAVEAEKGVEKLKAKGGFAVMRQMNRMDCRVKALGLDNGPLSAIIYLQRGVVRCGASPIWLGSRQVRCSCGQSRSQTDAVRCKARCVSQMGEAFTFAVSDNSKAGQSRRRKAKTR